MEKRYALFIFSLLMIFGFYFMLTMEGGITGFLSLSPQAITELDSCANISSPGYYVLNTSVISAGSCMNISSSDVVLDCNGSTITFGAGLGVRGIFANGEDGNPFNNITIRNCTINQTTDGLGTGLEFIYIENSTIINNTFDFEKSGSPYGVYLSDNDDIEIVNNHLRFFITNFGAPEAVFISSTSGEFYNNTILTYSEDGVEENRGFHVISNKEPLWIHDNRLEIMSADDKSEAIYEVGSGTNHRYYNNTIWVDGEPGRAVSVDSALTVGTQVLDNEIHITGRGAGTPSSGIYLIGAGLFTPVQDAIISGNEITIWDIPPIGSLAGIAGMDIARYTENITIENNDIDLAVGENWDYGLGIWISQATDVKARNNRINITGPRASNIGVRIDEGGLLTNITDNNITVNGTRNNWGVSITGASLGINIERNTINTNGNESGNTGIFTVHGATLKNNTIYPNGDRGSNTGITANATTSVYAEYNTIITNGTIDNHGIYFLSTNNSRAKLNDITTDGTNASYGIHVFTGYQNNISNNTVITPGGAALAPTLFLDEPGQHGIYVLGGTGHIIDNNTVYSGGDGIRLERNIITPQRSPETEKCDVNDIFTNKVKAVRNGFHSLFCSFNTIAANEFYGQERGMFVEGGSLLEFESAAEGGDACVQGAECDFPEECGDVGSCAEGGVFSLDLDPQAFGTCECSNCINGARCNVNEDCFGGVCIEPVSLPESLTPQYAGGTCDCGGPVGLTGGLSPQKATNTSSCQRNTAQSNTANSTNGIAAMWLGCVNERINLNKITSDDGTGLLLADTHDSTLGDNNITSRTATALRIGGGGTFFDGFEDGTLPPFTTQGAFGLNWTINNTVSYSGTYSVKAPSGIPSANLTLTQIIPQEGGVIQFALRTNLTDGQDITFYVNDTLVKQWTGNNSWEVYSFTLTGGVKTFRWEYTQEGPGPINPISAFIDDVTTIAEATDNDFDGNNLWTNGTNTWITVGQNSTGNNLTNTTFKESYGEIKLKDKFTIQSSRNVTKSKLNVTENLAFLNSSNLTEFNVSGSIVLTGNVGTTPTVDFEDDGTFVTCNAPQCTNVVTGANSIAYDVASFTGYSSEGGGPSPAPRRTTGGGGNRYAYVPDVQQETENKTETKAPKLEQPEETAEIQEEQESKTRSSRTRASSPGPKEEMMKVKKQEVTNEILRPATVAALILGTLGIFVYVAWRVQRPKDIDKLAKELDRIRDRLKKP